MTDKKQLLAHFHAIADRCRGTELDVTLNLADQAAVVTADDALLVIERARVKAGQTKNEARRKASAENGKRGGRPKKVKS